MKISYDDLKVLPHGRLEFSFNETLAGLDAVKPVVGDLSATIAASGMRVRGTVKTLLKLSCNRCLKPYFQAIAVDLDERFVNLVEYADFAGAETKDRELLKDDFFEYLPEDGLLDISDVVYQAVTLATPTFPFCGDECPGLPEKEARPGAGSGTSSGVVASSGDSTLDENSIDPRWKNLKTLFPKSKSGEES